MLSGLGFVFWVVVARIYPVEYVGIGAGLISALGLLSLVANLGIRTSLIRFLPTTENKTQLINSLFTMSTLFSLGLAGAFLYTIPWLSPELILLREAPYWMLFSLFLVSWVFYETFLNGIFISEKRAEIITIKSGVFSGTKLILVALLGFMGPFGLLASWGFGAITAALFVSMFYLPNLYPEFKLRFTINSLSIKGMMGFSFANYLATLFGTLPVYLMPILILHLLSAEETAYFYITFQIANLLQIIPTSISSSLLSEASHDEASAWNFRNKSMKFLLFLLVPVVVLMLLFGEDLLTIFGKEYSQNALYLLYLLVLSVFPASVVILYTTMKNVRKEIGRVMTVNAISSISIIILGYFLVTEMGILGIGVAWVLGRSLGALWVVGDLLMVKGALYQRSERYYGK